MKKLTLITICAAVLVLTGCFNSVFANIEKEVALTSGNVPGTINSILRFTDADGDWIVLSNGSDVYYKEAGIQRTDDHCIWTARGNETFNPVKYSYSDNKYIGKRIINLAADAEKIYALTCEIVINSEGENEPCNYEIYYTSSVTGEDWTLVEGADSGETGVLKEVFERSGDKMIGKVAVFSSNAVEKAGRSAYLRAYNNEAYEYYKLGTSLSKISPEASAIGGSETDPVQSVINFGGQDLFFRGKAAVAAGDTYYYAVGSNIYKKGEEKIFSASNKISTLSVTSDYLIFTCGESNASYANDGGIYHVKLDRINAADAEYPLSGSDSFSTNASAVMTSSYEIRAFLVENPEAKEAETNMYSSLVFKSTGVSISVSFENIGLWAYYPVNGNWNRE